MLKNLVLFALVSYQAHLAHANSFIQKPVRAGDNVISILRNYGFNDNQRENILSKSKDLRQMFLTLDTKYLVHTAKSEAEIRLYDSQTDAAFRVWRKGKDFGVESFDPHFKVTRLQVSGKVYGSLMASITDKVKSNWIASRFMDAYIFDVEARPSELERGAKFSLTVEKFYDEGQFIKYGEVLNTALEVDGHMLEKKFIRSKAGGVFVTEDDWLSKKPFYAPVNYLRVASLFQPHRRHPITKRLQPHLGVDLELPAGSPVFAARDGVVARTGHNHAAGNFVVLRHSNGIETAYDHLSRTVSYIRPGRHVHVGEKIAEVGCTGYCTRSHLHFAVKEKGRMVDPLKYTKPYPIGMESLLQSKLASN
jgi:murein DD-endopeptidase MepM/ murein hydrolase activator NlpD